MLTFRKLSDIHLSQLDSSIYDLPYRYLFLVYINTEVVKTMGVDEILQEKYS